MLKSWAASQQRGEPAPPPFDPASLFAGGEQGFWLDPSDFTTMFQDAAGTTPVTAPGQSVGRILDKSGNDNTFTQGTDVNRPVLQQDGSGNYYLAFDGSISGIASAASVDFSAVDQVTACVGVRKLSDAARGMLLELANNLSGSFQINAPRNAAADYSFISRGNMVSDAVATPYASPITNVLTGLGDISADTCIIRMNGAQITSSASDQGSGNYMNATVYVGRRGGSTLPFNGRLYQMLVRGALTSGDDLTDLETYVNGKTGAY